MSIFKKKHEQNRYFYDSEITAEDLPQNTHSPLRDKILGAAVLFIVFAISLWLVIFLFKKLFAFASNPQEFQNFIENHGALGRAAFLGIQILQGFIPIPLEITAVAGGCAFGSLQGCVLTIVSVIISTTVIFYFTKLCGTKLYRLFFSSAEEMGIKLIRRPKFRNTLYWIVFLIPGTPKRIFVFTAGLVPQNFGKFLFISTTARIPSFLACSFGGFALSNGDYKKAVILLGIIVIFSIAGILLYQYLSNKIGKKGSHYNKNNYR